MTRAKQRATKLPSLTTNGLGLILSGCVLSVVIAGTCCQVSVAGNHHIESPAHRTSGCVDGNCDVPTAYGYYRGGWRRWPGSRDSTMDGDSAGTTTREPFVPEPFEEGRTRPRTRSDKPLDPDEMPGAGASIGQPMIPGPGDEANPFSTSVPESDLPEPETGNPFGGGDPGLAPTPTDNGFGGGNAAGGDAGGGLFDSDLTEPDPGGGFDFDPPGGAGETDPADAELFPFSGPTRSIKSRGLQLQKGIRLNSLASLPSAVRGPKFDLPVEDSVGGKFSDGNIDLVSFDGIDPSDFEALSTPAQPKPKTLSGSQVQEATQLETQSTDRNPLRRGGPQLRRKTVGKQSASVEQLVDSTDLEIETPIDLPQTSFAGSKPVNRSLATATSNRSLRSNSRKNPLRR